MSYHVERGFDMSMPIPAVDDVDLGQVLRALAEPLRRDVISQLVADRQNAERACGSFDLPVTKSTKTHHWRVLREAGLISQRDAGNGTFIRLRRGEFEQRFPGLLDTVCRLSHPPGDGKAARVRPSRRGRAAG
ncbi:MAG: ArsR/SmtB family transcription factor [Mycobacteriales bacterium]